MKKYYKISETEEWTEPDTYINTIPIESQPVRPKLCPFRKKIYIMTGNQDGVFNTYLEKAEYFEEEFQPCLQEQCAVWNEEIGACTH